MLIALYPSTVYSEAAKAYTIRCLFSLEEPEAANLAKKRIADLDNILKSQQELLKLATKLEVPEKTLKHISMEIADLEEKLNGLKNIPIGKDAANLAEQKAKDFVFLNSEKTKVLNSEATKVLNSEETEVSFGLYRGEILVLLAERDFWKHLEPEKAERSYVRAW